MYAMKCFCSVILIFLLSGFPALGQKGKPWWEAGQPRWAKSDLGGVFSATIDLRGAKPATVFKAIAVSLGEKGNRVTGLEIGIYREPFNKPCAMPLTICE